MNNPEDLKEIEATLAALIPTASALDRDQLMFLAGRAAAEADVARPVRMPGWLWPAATAASMLVTVTLAGLLFAHSSSTVVQQSPHESESSTAVRTAAEWPAWTEGWSADAWPGVESLPYLALRHRVLAIGNNDLADRMTTESDRHIATEPLTEPSQPSNSRQLLESLIREADPSYRRGRVLENATGRGDNS